LSDHEIRKVVLVLTTPDGVAFGQLPPFPVATPWWSQVEPVVAACRALHGFSPVILRLLAADRPGPPGGTVTYLAEVPERRPADPWLGRLADDPRRLSYARPGGPAADLAWARSAMLAHSVRGTGEPIQVRTWNLSCLWRLPSERGMLWLKVLPPFAAPEGPLLGMLANHPVPRLLASDQRRLLMFEAPGRDLYDVGEPLLSTTVEHLVRLQAELAADVDQLIAMGLPDWRRAPATADLTSVLERELPAIPAAAGRARLRRFVSGLDDRFAAIEACGLPATLVHGDFHPGNVHGDGATSTLLDFADSIVGHPLLDLPTFVDGIAPATRDRVRQTWFAAWRAAAPGCDPERAAMLLAPIASARQMATYRAFLDAIEPSEHPYHCDHPRIWLEHALELLGAEGHV
jgi:Phosphotransferase enzyme family